MNSSTSCHEIEGVPCLYVDAFRGSYLQKTTNIHNTFILSHYHGDHYQSLQRDGKYQGPALIHCTLVTAALLRKVHKVPPEFVIEHEYGIPWRVPIRPQDDKHNQKKQEEATITFYDANHCPGAAIITIQLPDGRVHLHTGDMRYHPKMQEYPVVKKAVQNRKLDLLYLDTTYGHPKHDFLSQDVAVDRIATQIHDILAGHDQCGPPPPSSTRCDDTKPKALILLSTYSIGKEKILWETSLRTNQSVYVTDRKLTMMQCIQTGQSASEKEQTTEQGEASSDHLLPCNQMIERCCSDPNGTDLHVIPMGLAGEMHPYWQPNYRKCADYAEELDRRYDKVYAFIPTGWADSSNWNKKNAVSQRQLECRKSKRHIDVEIRLISYSEHSTCPELETFVKFLRPRKVIPTVFSDANDRRRLEKLFRKYVDTSRAKLQFFKGMQGNATNTTSSNSVPSWTSSSKRISEPDTLLSDSKSINISKKGQEIKTKAEPIAELLVAKDDTKTSNECIDLTFSSDDENDQNETPKKVPPNTATSIDSSKYKSSDALKPLKPAPSAVSAKTTPAKRQRRESPSKEKTSTPPITKFFAVKKR